MRFSIFLFCFSVSATLARGQAAPGSYVAKSLDAKVLPAELRLATTPGYYRWYRLDEALLRLKPKGRFTVSYRYSEQHLPVGKRPSDPKLMTENQQGGYSLKDGAITLIPDKPKSGNRPPRMIGRATGKGIILPYDLRDGKAVKRHDLLLVFDPSYW